MSQYTGLPVFAYIDEKLQIQQLREFFLSLGASVKPEGPEDNAENILDLVHHCGILGSKLDSDNEVEMTLNSLVSLITPLAAHQVVAVVKAFCAKLSGSEFEGSGAQSKAGAAVRALSNLFHGFGGADNAQRILQYDIYCCMLRLAIKNGGLIQELPTDLNVVKDWFTVWKLSTEQTRECLRLLHKALVQQNSAEASRVMVELLGTYTEQDAEKAVADARECVRTAIAEPNTFLFDHLLRLRPVQCLEKGAPKVYQLLNIFVSGYLLDYVKFYEADRNFIEGELKLDNGRLRDKMQILTLMSYGEKKDEIEFKELTTLLQLAEGEELEDFVIRAVQSKAVKARMDQVKSRLIIEGVRHRKFERAQWEQLQGRLNSWASNLHQTKTHLDAVLVEG